MYIHISLTIMKGDLELPFGSHSPQIFCLSQVTLGLSYFLGSPISEKIMATPWPALDRKTLESLEMDIISPSEDSTVITQKWSGWSGCCFFLLLPFRNFLSYSWPWRDPIEPWAMAGDPSFKIPSIHRGGWDFFSILDDHQTFETPQALMHWCISHYFTMEADFSTQLGQQSSPTDQVHKWLIGVVANPSRLPMLLRSQSDLQWLSGD